MLRGISTIKICLVIQFYRIGEICWVKKFNRVKWDRRRAVRVCKFEGLTGLLGLLGFAGLGNLAWRSD